MFIHYCMSSIKSWSDLDLDFLHNFFNCILCFIWARISLISIHKCQQYWEQTTLYMWAHRFDKSDLDLMTGIVDDQHLCLLNSRYINRRHRIEMIYTWEILHLLAASSIMHIIWLWSAFVQKIETNTEMWLTLTITLEVGNWLFWTALVLNIFCKAISKYSKEFCRYHKLQAYFTQFIGNTDLTMHIVFFCDRACR